MSNYGDILYGTAPSDEELERLTRPENKAETTATTAEGQADGPAATGEDAAGNKPRKMGRPKGSKQVKKSESGSEAATPVKVLSLEDINSKGHSSAHIPRVSSNRRVTQHEFQLALAALEKLPTRNPNEITLGESERSQALVDTGTMHSLVLKNYSLVDIVQIMENAGTPVKAKAVQLRYIRWLKENGLEMPDYYRGKLSLADQGDTGTED